MFKNFIILTIFWKKNPKGLRLRLLDLTNNKRPHKRYKLEYEGSKIQVPKLINKWTNLKFLINFDQNDAVLDLFFNEEKIANCLKFDVPCNDIKMSIGLERHGSSKKKHALSVIDYDKFIVNKVN